MFPGVLETLLHFICVTYLSNKRCSYHLWLLVITKSGRMTTSNKFNRLQIDLFFFSANINSPISPSPPPCLNIDPSNQIFPISLYTLRAYWQEFTVYYWGKTSFEGTDQRRAKRTRVSKCNYNVVGKTGEAHEIIYHNKSDDVECVEDMKKHGMHIQQNWCAGPRNFFQGSNIEELL